MLCLGASKNASAYPLDSNETIVSQRSLPNGSVQVFTNKDNAKYLKTFEFLSGSWVLENTREVKMNKTGLILKGTAQITDPELSKSIGTKLKSSGIILGALPSSVDYSSSPYLPPVGLQTVNDCAEWATGYYLRTYQKAKDLGWNVTQNGWPVNSHIFSPSFIYNQLNGGVDNGSALEDVGNLIETEGNASLSDFPDVPGDYLTQPSTAVIKAAYPYRIKQWNYLFIPSDSADFMMQQTKEYLNTGDLPVIGVNIGYNYEYPEIYNGKSFITYDTSYIGAHALTVVGYDDNIQTPDGRGAFKIINSWGTDWGNNGFGYITYQEFIKSAIEGFVFTDLVIGRTVDTIDPASISTQVLSPTQIQYSWGAPKNAQGYKIFDESFNLMANVTPTQYTETLSQPGVYTRYLQAYNSVSADDPVKVTVNTTNVKSTQLPIQIKNNFKFNIQFNGSGTYSTTISDSNGKVVNILSNLQTAGGLTSVPWSGNDASGNPVPDGNYGVTLTTNPNGKVQTLYKGTFNKKSNLVSGANAEINQLNGVIQSVIVHVTTVSDAMVNINVNNAGIQTELEAGQPIKAGQQFDYTIPQTMFDFNKVDLSRMRIVLDVE